MLIHPEIMNRFYPKRENADTPDMAYVYVIPEDVGGKKNIFAVSESGRCLGPFSSKEEVETYLKSIGVKISGFEETRFDRNPFTVMA